MEAMRARAKAPAGMDDATVAALYLVSLLAVGEGELRRLLDDFTAERLCERLRVSEASEPLCPEERLALRTTCLLQVARQQRQRPAPAPARPASAARPSLEGWAGVCDRLPPAVRTHMGHTLHVDAEVLLRLVPVALVRNALYEKQLFALLGSLPPGLVRSMDVLTTVEGIALSQPEATELAELVLQGRGGGARA
jgi:hypothetical protein